MKPIMPQFPPIAAKDFITHFEALEDVLKDKESHNGLFLIKTANQWMDEAKRRPIPKMLFDKFWYEGELCILFADTNLGKSILAVQIGDSISQGANIPGFKLEAPKQKVLYFDFELSDKQFEARYSENFRNHYGFDSNFFRVEVNPNANIPEGAMEQHLYDSFEQTIEETEARVLIVDNLTYLKNGTEKAQDALPLMKYLKGLKSKYGLSILALAHTPKRDLSKPLNRNDLQGSKMLINFCDSSFAVGESQTDNAVRYLKQIKARNTEIVYDNENVVVCQIGKPINFLQFEFLCFGNEREHLKQVSENDRESLIQKVKELSQQGKSQRFISSETGLSLGAVNKYLKK
ncbi:MAG: AAA family ATPase [Mangrovibacterium sp.]|nr:AAA family ATPase [Mangrovibacterium sp.]